MTPEAEPRISGAVQRCTARHGGLGFGADYNPEQWPREVWLEDARLMQQAGVTFVTVGVFAWAQIEPAPGSREFGWLDEVMDLLHAHGIGVDLATATASAPPWLTSRHPEVLPVDRHGVRLAHGSRQSWCPSSPLYREHALALVRDLAQRYADHPALRLWHVSNELGCHNAPCYCEVSAAAFRDWLRARYADLDALNDAWGTTFWSQRYGAWEEVTPPRLSTAQPNPTQELDFRRFSSDALLEHYRAERQVLREASPGVPVTTNFMVAGHVDDLDYWAWAPEQDIVSNDHYLDGSLADPHVELAFCADWTRGLAEGKPWILMEHSTSAVNWQPRNYPKRPGQMHRNTLQHVARGADAVAFFQWRASRAGAEKYHSAMLPHTGVESRVWQEVVELGQILGRLGEVAGSVPRGKVALLLDYESWWAVERGSLPSTDVRYLDRAHAFYRALWDRGVLADVRHPGHDDLSEYDLVIAPTLHLVRDTHAQRLADYVREGGLLLVTYFSGIVDEHDHVRLGGYPGAFRELLGIRVDEFCPLPPGEVVGLQDGSGVSGRADTWAEDLTLRGATAVQTYADGPLRGVPAVTRHPVGAGAAWYVATRTDPATTSALLDQMLLDSGVATVDHLDDYPAGVETVRRTRDGQSWIFVINHTENEVRLPYLGWDLVTDRRVADRLVLEPGAVACLREEQVA